jgi:hypothetical protein
VKVIAFFSKPVLLHLSTTSATIALSRIIYRRTGEFYSHKLGSTLSLIE